MSKLNHNRPSLTKQDLWIKHDSHVSFAQSQRTAAANRGLSLNASTTNKPQSVKQLDPASKLGRALTGYQGSESRLLVIRDKARYGELLTSKEMGWASERFQFLSQVQDCIAKLSQPETDGNAEAEAEALASASAADLTLLNDPSLTYQQLAKIKKSLGNAQSITEAL